MSLLALAHCISPACVHHNAPDHAAHTITVGQARALYAAIQEAAAMPATAAFAPGNSSSAEAAQKIQPKLEGKRLDVLEFIRGRGDRGATGSEIAEALGLLLYTAKPRCSELRAAGLIYDSGEKRRNAARSNETVWRAIDLTSHPA